MKKLITILILFSAVLSLGFSASKKSKSKAKKVRVDTNIQAVYSENPNWDQNWSTRIPDGETTKWKVSEIWFYSTDKLEFTEEFNTSRRNLEKKVQAKIPGCVLIVNNLEKDTYKGWMPPNSKYALFVRLESKYCYEEGVWCETLNTSLLQEVYDIILDSAPDFITNY